MDSILTSIKKLLGIDESYTQFDTDLIMHINSVFMILSQLGIGPSTPFLIQDKYSTWDEFIEEGDPQYEKMELVKSYMYLKVKLLFDPPLSSSVVESIKNQINELEWRLNIAVDPPSTNAEIQNGGDC